VVRAANHLPALAALGEMEMDEQKNFEVELEKQRQKNIARREAHPDWPAHVPTFDTSDIPTPEEIAQQSPIYTITVEKTPFGPRFTHHNATLPIGKTKHRGYCKYCYTYHRRWWMMDQRDYHSPLNDKAPTPGETVLLCGYCQHTSQKQFTYDKPLPPKPTLEWLKQIIRRHTKAGPHQDAAHELLNANFIRFAPEIKSITCRKCKSTLADCVRWTDSKTGQIVDSWGYLEADGDICYRCLDEGFIGDIL
jgi:hypothetical protein